MSRCRNIWDTSKNNSQYYDAPKRASHDERLNFFPISDYQVHGEPTECESCGEGYPLLYVILVFHSSFAYGIR